MAKVTGPLMSLDASGGFAGTLVFGKWKGRNTVRQLVTPSNPQTANQEKGRNAVRAVGTMQHWANLSILKGSARLVKDKLALIAGAPAGQAWNGWLSKLMIGTGAIAYDAATTAWAALSAPNKATWETAATSKVPAIPVTYQTTALGIAAPSMTAGEAFFRYQTALYAAGIAPAIVAATPPAYI
jgi:hypothetical protein